MTTPMTRAQPPVTRRQVRRAVMQLPLPLSRYLLLLQEHKRLPHLIRPRTFQDKLNYRIVHDRRALLAMASSKVESKAYVTALGTGVQVPATYWTGTDLAELHGQVVPTPWVLKASHRSGRLVHGDAGVLDVDDIDIDVAEWLVDREYLDDRLWGYGATRKELLLEERVGGQGQFPDDLKFFVFDGRVEMIQVDHGRRAQHTRNLYLPDWTPLPWNYTRPTGPWQPAPENLPELVRAASRLGEGFDFIRVDLYNLPTGIYFGELTAYPGAGVSPWPRDLDRFLGAKWTLPGRSVLAALG